MQWCGFFAKTEEIYCIGYIERANIGVVLSIRSIRQILLEYIYNLKPTLKSNQNNQRSSAERNRSQASQF